LDAEILAGYLFMLPQQRTLSKGVDFKRGDDTTRLVLPMTLSTVVPTSIGERMVEDIAKILKSKNEGAIEAGGRVLPPAR